jgi:hypothetical protein
MLSDSFVKVQMDVVITGLVRGLATKTTAVNYVASVLGQSMNSK